MAACTVEKAGLGRFRRTASSLDTLKPCIGLAVNKLSSICNNQTLVAGSTARSPVSDKVHRIDEELHMQSSACRHWMCHETGTQHPMN